MADVNKLLPDVGNIDLGSTAYTDDDSLQDITNKYTDLGNTINSLGNAAAEDVHQRQVKLIGNDFGPVNPMMYSAYYQPSINDAESSMRVKGTQKALEEGMDRGKKAAEANLAAAKSTYQKSIDAYNNAKEAFANAQVAILPNIDTGSSETVTGANASAFKDFINDPEKAKNDIITKYTDQVAASRDSANFWNSNDAWDIAKNNVRQQTGKNITDDEFRQNREYGQAVTKAYIEEYFSSRGETENLEKFRSSYNYMKKAVNDVVDYISGTIDNPEFLVNKQLVREGETIEGYDNQFVGNFLENGQFDNIFGFSILDMHELVNWKRNNPEQFAQYNEQLAQATGVSQTLEIADGKRWYLMPDGNYKQLQKGTPVFFAYPGSMNNDGTFNDDKLEKFIKLYRDYYQTDVTKISGDELTQRQEALNEAYRDYMTHIAAVIQYETAYDQQITPDAYNVILASFGDPAESDKAFRGIAISEWVSSFKNFLEKDRNKAQAYLAALATKANEGTGTFYRYDPSLDKIVIENLKYDEGTAAAGENKMQARDAYENMTLSMTPEQAAAELQIYLRSMEKYNDGSTQKNINPELLANSDFENFSRSVARMALGTIESYKGLINLVLGVGNNILGGETPFWDFEGAGLLKDSSFSNTWGAIFSGEQKKSRDTVTSGVQLEMALDDNSRDMVMSLVNPLMIDVILGDKDYNDIKGVGTEYSTEGESMFSSWRGFKKSAINLGSMVLVGIAEGAVLGGIGSGVSAATAAAMNTKIAARVELRLMPLAIKSMTNANIEKATTALSMLNDPYQIAYGLRNAKDALNSARKVEAATATEKLKVTSALEDVVKKTANKTDDTAEMFGMLSREAVHTLTSLDSNKLDDLAATYKSLLREARARGINNLTEAKAYNNTKVILSDGTKLTLPEAAVVVQANRGLGVATLQMVTGLPLNQIASLPDEYRSFLMQTLNRMSGGSTYDKALMNKIHGGGMTIGSAATKTKGGLNAFLKSMNAEDFKTFTENMIERARLNASMGRGLEALDIYRVAAKSGWEKSAGRALAREFLADALTDPFRDFRMNIIAPEMDPEGHFRVQTVPEYFTDPRNIAMNLGFSTVHFALSRIKNQWGSTHYSNLAAQASAALNATGERTAEEARKAYQKAFNLQNMAQQYADNAWKAGMSYSKAQALVSNSNVMIKQSIGQIFEANGIDVNYGGENLHIDTKDDFIDYINNKKLSPQEGLYILANGLNLYSVNNYYMNKMSIGTGVGEFGNLDSNTYLKVYRTMINSSAKYKDVVRSNDKSAIKKINKVYDQIKADVLKANNSGEFGLKIRNFEKSLTYMFDNLKASAKAGLEDGTLKNVRLGYLPIGSLTYAGSFDDMINSHTIAPSRGLAYEGGVINTAALNPSEARDVLQFEDIISAMEKGEKTIEVNGETRQLDYDGLNPLDMLSVYQNNYNVHKYLDPLVGDSRLKFGEAALKNYNAYIVASSEAIAKARNIDIKHAHDKITGYDFKDKKGKKHHVDGWADKIEKAASERGDDIAKDMKTLKKGKAIDTTMSKKIRDKAVEISNQINKLNKKVADAQNVIKNGGISDSGYAVVGKLFGHTINGKGNPKEGRKIFENGRSIASTLIEAYSKGTLNEGNYKDGFFIDAQFMGKVYKKNLAIDSDTFKAIENAYKLGAPDADISIRAAIMSDLATPIDPKTKKPIKGYTSKLRELDGPQKGSQSLTEGVSKPVKSGRMDFSYGNGAGDGITEKTTFEAIKSGKRTSTTRLASQHADYWKDLKVGDVVEFKNKGNTDSVLVRVTKAPEWIDPSKMSVDEYKALLSKEGWSKKSFDKIITDKVKSGDKALQFEYELVKDTTSLADEEAFVKSSANSKVEYYRQYWTADTVKANPDKVFLFGDNILDAKNGYKPKGTQAVIRGEKNAIGIPTKRNRYTTPGSYFKDSEFELFKSGVDKAMAQARKAMDEGKTVVIPANGIGTGAAKLKQKAPKCFEYLQNELGKLDTNLKSSIDENGLIVMPKTVGDKLGTANVRVANMEISEALLPKLSSPEARQHFVDVMNTRYKSDQSGVIKSQESKYQEMQALAEDFTYKGLGTTSKDTNEVKKRIVESLVDRARTELGTELDGFDGHDMLWKLDEIAPDKDIIDVLVNRTAANTQNMFAVLKGIDEDGAIELFIDRLAKLKYEVAAGKYNDILPEGMSQEDFCNKVNDAYEIMAWATEFDAKPTRMESEPVRFGDDGEELDIDEAGEFGTRDITGNVEIESMTGKFSNAEMNLNKDDMLRRANSLSDILEIYIDEKNPLHDIVRTEELKKLHSGRLDADNSTEALYKEVVARGKELYDSGKSPAYIQAVDDATSAITNRISDAGHKPTQEQLDAAYAEALGITSPDTRLNQVASNGKTSRNYNAAKLAEATNSVDTSASGGWNEKVNKMRLDAGTYGGYANQIVNGIQALIDFAGSDKKYAKLLEQATDIYLGMDSVLNAKRSGATDNFENSLVAMLGKVYDPKNMVKELNGSEMIEAGTRIKRIITSTIETGLYGEPISGKDVKFEGFSQLRPDKTLGNGNVNRTDSIIHNAQDFKTYVDLANALYAKNNAPSDMYEAYASAYLTDVRRAYDNYVAKFEEANSVKDNNLVRIDEQIREKIANIESEQKAKSEKVSDLNTKRQQLLDEIEKIKNDSSNTNSQHEIDVLNARIKGLDVELKDANKPVGISGDIIRLFEKRKDYLEAKTGKNITVLGDEASSKVAKLNELKRQRAELVRTRESFDSQTEDASFEKAKPTDAQKESNRQAIAELNNDISKLEREIRDSQIPKTVDDAKKLLESIDKHEGEIKSLERKPMQFSTFKTNLEESFNDFREVIHDYYDMAREFDDMRQSTPTPSQQTGKTSLYDEKVLNYIGGQDLKARRINSDLDIEIDGKKFRLEADYGTGNEYSETGLGYTLYGEDGLQYNIADEFERAKDKDATAKTINEKLEEAGAKVRIVHDSELGGKNSYGDVVQSLGNEWDIVNLLDTDSEGFDIETRDLMNTAWNGGYERSQQDIIASTLFDYAKATEDSSPAKDVDDANKVLEEAKKEKDSLRTKLNALKEKADAGAVTMDTYAKKYLDKSDYVQYRADADAYNEIKATKADESDYYRSKVGEYTIMSDGQIPKGHVSVASLLTLVGYDNGKFNTDISEGRQYTADELKADYKAHKKMQKEVNDNLRKGNMVYKNVEDFKLPTDLDYRSRAMTINNLLSFMAQAQKKSGMKNLKPENVVISKEYADLLFRVSREGINGDNMWDKVKTTAFRISDWNKFVQDLQLAGGASYVNALTIAQIRGAIFSSPTRAAEYIKLATDFKDDAAVAKFVVENSERLAQIAMKTGDTTILTDFQASASSRPGYSDGGTISAFMARVIDHNKHKSAAERTTEEKYDFTRDYINNAKDALFGDATFKRTLPVLRAKMMIMNYDQAYKMLQKKFTNITADELEDAACKFAYAKTTAFFEPNKTQSGLFKSRGINDMLNNVHDQTKRDLLAGWIGGKDEVSLGQMLGNCFFALGYKSRMIQSILQGVRSIVSPVEIGQRAQTRGVFDDAAGTIKLGANETLDMLGNQFMQSGNRQQIRSIAFLAITAFVTAKALGLATAWDDLNFTDEEQTDENGNPQFKVPDILTKFQTIGQIWIPNAIDQEGHPYIDPKKKAFKLDTLSSIFTLPNTAWKTIDRMTDPEAYYSAPQRGLPMLGVSNPINQFLNADIPRAIGDELIGSNLLSPYKAMYEVLVDSTYYGNNIWEKKYLKDGSVNKNYDLLRNIRASIYHVLGFDGLLSPRGYNDYVKGYYDNPKYVAQDQIGTITGSGIFQHEYTNALISFMNGEMWDGLVEAGELPVKQQRLSSTARTELNTKVKNAIAQYVADYKDVIANTTDVDAKDAAYEKAVKRSADTLQAWSKKYNYVLGKDQKLLPYATRMMMSMLAGEYDDNLDYVQNTYWKASAIAQIEATGPEGYWLDDNDIDAWVASGKTPEEFAEEKNKRSNAYNQALDDEYRARKALHDAGVDSEYLAGMSVQNLRAEQRQINKEVYTGALQKMNSPIGEFKNFGEMKKYYETQIDAAGSTKQKAKLAEQYNTYVTDALAPYIEKYGEGIIADGYYNNEYLSNALAEYIIIPADKYYAGKTPRANYLKDLFHVGFRDSSKLPSDKEVIAGYEQAQREMHKGYAASAVSILDRMIDGIKKGRMYASDRDYNNLVRMKAYLSSKSN